MDSNIKTNKGHCIICESETVFIEYNPWLRDHYKCSKCDSIPRHRALINALNTFDKKWRQKIIHESSPCGQASNFLKRKCKSYTESQYFTNIPFGKYSNGVRCENLEQLTFDNNSFDILVTQDVFEHVMKPDLAFKEINRVLRPGGIHIFTMPWYPNQNTLQRVKFENGYMEYLQEPIYHGNPVDKKGSIVTYDWGIDFPDYVYRCSGMFTTVFLKIDRNLGLDADFLEVFVSRKTFN